MLNHFALFNEEGQGLAEYGLLLTAVSNSTTFPQASIGWWSFVITSARNFT
ncbi:hypothetical protein [Candidatus Leptofilum sp.]|uniref:hypothetical protein n=1 Tax=Candidatus Leptofilum sp. TaxID=3241576 RepID=UPI003B58E988